MDIHMSSGVLAHIMDSMFQYGCYWISLEHLEGVRRVMVEEHQDIQLLDQAIANGYQRIATIHAKVQARLHQYHLLLGYCPTTSSIIVVDDELD